MGYIAKLVSCSRGVSGAYLSLQRPSFLILIKYSLMITSHSAARLQQHKTSLGDSWQDDISFASHPPCHRVLLSETSLVVTWPVILQSQLWPYTRDAAIRWPRTGNIIDCDKRKLYPHHLRTGNTFTRYYSDLFWKLYRYCAENVAVCPWCYDCYMLHATKLSQESELFSHNNDSFEADTKLMDFAEKQKVFIFARGSRSAKSEECPNVSRPVEQFSVITAARAWQPELRTSGKTENSLLL